MNEPNPSDLSRRSGVHVAVLKGVWSPERPVSLVSGKACAEALRAQGYRVTEIDVGRDIALVLSQILPDVAFNALHGPFGEDGTIQGLLEIQGIAYTHSGVLASALAMDKARAKTIFEAAGIPCAAGSVVPREAAAAKHMMDPPYVIKPINQGSSFGVFIVRDGDNRPPELLGGADWSLGDEVLVERFVPGRELTVSVLGDRALGVTEILAKSDFYDYESKYEAGGSDHILPADIPETVYRSACEWAVEAHAALGCHGVTRSDFRYDAKAPPGQDLIILEVNTQPGMTPTSLVPEQADHVGIGFGDLVTWLVETATCRP
ncbi:MAG: D-alanine--D-alanine ligase [Pseudomonadota bacterium]